MWWMSGSPTYSSLNVSQDCWILSPLRMQLVVTTWQLAVWRGDYNVWWFDLKFYGGLWSLPLRLAVGMSLCNSYIVEVQNEKQPFTLQDFWNISRSSIFFVIIFALWHSWYMLSWFAALLCRNECKEDLGAALQWNETFEGKELKHV